MAHEAVAVRLPFESVTDGPVTLLEWLVDHGQYVEADRSLALVETTNTVADVPAPVAGVVCRVVSTREVLPAGSVLCYIGADLDAAVHAAATPVPVLSRTSTIPVNRAVVLDDCAPASAPVQPGASRVPTLPPRPPRLSRAARALMETLSVEPATLTGRLLVRARDLRARMADAAPAMTDPAPVAQDRVGDPPSADTHVSRGVVAPGSVTVAVPSDGRLIGVEGGSASFGATLIFECARLLVRYPDLNAVFSEADVRRHASIDVGYLMDFAASPPASVIAGADRKDLETIDEEYARAVRAYLRGMGPAEPGPATFTIADLSTAGVVHVQPVVPPGQSAALAISAMTPAWPGSGFFNLVLAFDPRVVSGRAAAAFLEELRDRLIAHEQASAAAEAPGIAEPECGLCLRPMSELENARHMLVRTLVGAGRGEQLVCTICLRDWCA